MASQAQTKRDINSQITNSVKHNGYSYIARPCWGIIHITKMNSNGNVVLETTIPRARNTFMSIEDLKTFAQSN